jgi:UDP-N-acetyl-2-amino-2-deoxyglucuronate dehydrogenase
MNKRIQFAIVGCGRIGSRHAEYINKAGILAAVCDIDETKARALSANYNVPSYIDLNEMLANEPAMEVLVVCTPNGLHALHSIAASNAGKHVLCEKPMAIHATDCAAMITAAEKNNRMLFVVKQNRFNPPVVAVKQALEKNALGKIYSVQLNCFWNRDEAYYHNSWKGTQSLDGGTLFTQFSHFIDLLYWMFGDVKKVVALTDNFAHRGVIEFEDTGIVALQFESGALGSIHFTVNAFRKNMEGSLSIFAEKGTVKIGGQYLNELEYQCIDNYRIEGLPPGKPSNDYGTYQGSMSNHDKVYENVLAVLTENKEINTPACEALKTVEIINKIYNAASIFSR